MDLDIGVPYISNKIVVCWENDKGSDCGSSELMGTDDIPVKSLTIL